MSDFSPETEKLSNFDVANIFLGDLSKIGVNLMTGKGLDKLDLQNAVNAFTQAKGCTIPDLISGLIQVGAMAEE